MTKWTGLWPIDVFIHMGREFKVEGFFDRKCDNDNNHIAVVSLVTNPEGPNIGILLVVDFQREREIRRCGSSFR